MSASKYWGDERHSDAIYAVYLKKVRYVPPQQYEGLPHYRAIDPDSHHLAADIASSDHLQWETIRERIIKAGTLKKLVESLINMEDSRMDSRQFNVFFSTFRAFAEPEAVLNTFIEWYEVVVAHYLPSTTNDTSNCMNLTNLPLGSEPSTPLASTSASFSSIWTSPKCPQTLLNTIRSILICWLDMYPEDFYATNTEDAKFFLLTRLIDFARLRSLYDLKHKARKVRERFKRIAEEGGLAVQIPSLVRYSYANTVCYDPHDLGYARHRSQMFDVSRDNCVQIAEQLTFWDAVLFRELRPYQCQGAIWGKRHKTRVEAVYSVRATIDQFNAVSQRVMTSIVFPDCSPDFRAKILEKWIDIARELRALKNFSSLKAIISTLQSEPVYRLKSMWAIVSKVSLSQFKQLSEIFNADENGDESRARSILEAEGTAKNSAFKRSPAGANNLLGVALRPNASNCRRTKSDVNLAADSQGTVPFLGSFLTDLTMIDNAHSDNTPEGLINFEKRRREFEILAKIRLFQSAARAYTVPMDQAFCIWFYYLPSVNEKECFLRSLEVEPISTTTPDALRRTSKGGGTFNGLYSSPSMSISKFHSLTKMFAGSSVNETSSLGGCESANTTSQSTTEGTERGALNDRSKIPSNFVHDSHQRHPSSSFVGQRSNDSGIQTEESIYSTSNAANGTEEETAQNGNSTDGAELLASTPTGSFSTRCCVDAKTTDCSDYSSKMHDEHYLGSEFKPYLHFCSSINPTSRQAYDEISTTTELNDQKAEIQDSTPSSSQKNYNYQEDSGRKEKDEQSGRLETMISQTLPSSVLCSSSSLQLSEDGGGSVRNGGDKNSFMKQLHVNSHYSPSQQQYTLTQSERMNGKIMHQKSHSSSSSCSSSFTGSANVSSPFSVGGSSRRGGGRPVGLPPSHPTSTKDFHLARVGLDDSIFSDLPTDGSTINYKCIKVENGDRMATLIERALEKHMIDVKERANVCLVQLLPDGSEFKLPDQCNPFYAVAPDSTSPMLNFLLKKRQIWSDSEGNTTALPSEDTYGMGPSTKKLNKQKRSNLLRWSSGYL